MNVKIIKSEHEYEQAMARLSALMSRDLKPGSKDENELELLALVIGDYERQTVPAVKVDPIESILFRMDQMKLSRKDLVPFIGSLSKVSEVLARKRPLSLSMIRRLHRGLDIPAEILIEDMSVDSAIVCQDPPMDFTRFPLKEMMDRGCFADAQLNAQQLKHLTEYAEDLMHKFMEDLLPKQVGQTFMRAPMHQRGVRHADEMALLAWRLCVLRQARAVTIAKQYNPGVITLAWLRDLAKLSAFDEGPKLAREHLARHGITLVVEKHFKGTFLDGGAMLDGDRPIVALTLRHDRLDNFWFVLMHELAHVAKDLSPESPVFIDDLDGKDPQEIETQADAMAMEALIPAKHWRDATVRKTLLSKDAKAFADKLGIHVAIVAGRLRHETSNYRLLSHLIGKTGQVSQLLV